MKQQINIRPGQAILISITWKNFRRNRNKNNETWTEETGNLITGNFSVNVVLPLLNFNENLLFRHFENAYRVFRRRSFIKFLGGIRIMDIVGILCNDVWGNIDVYSDWICKYILTQVLYRCTEENQLRLKNTRKTALTSTWNALDCPINKNLSD